MRLSINKIRTDGGTQARAKINQRIVEEYAQALHQGHHFPPIVVFYDGTHHWLADGFHRLEASRYANFQDIETDLKLGTLREAVLYAVGANVQHGLRRTPADKQQAVKLLLEDKEWGQWSDRMIAKQTVTSHPFVARVRSSIKETVSTVRTYTNKHGSLSTMETGQIGKLYKTSETESYSLPLQLSLIERLQKYQEKLELDSLEETITKILDTYTEPWTTKPITPIIGRWIGLDPGLAVVRWAVLEGKENSYALPKVLDYGTIETTKKRPTSERLGELEQDLVSLLREFQPTNVALELPFISDNPKTTRTVLEALGVIQLVCYRERKITPVHLYPSMWKAQVASGRAEPEEITDTLSALFELKDVSRSRRLDAIGIAYAGFCGVKVEQN